MFPYQFKTQKAAKEEVRERISRYEAGDQLSLEDQAFFSELFKLHDEYAEKVGCGISCIKVEKDFHNKKCLYIHRLDGSRIDISWVHCIQPASQKAVVSVAFRRAVKERIIHFKSQRISEQAKCPILHVPLDFDNSHVVYVERAFDDLLSSFLKDVGLDIAAIELENPKPDDSDQRGIIKDQELRIAWVEYHQKNAQLELWSAEANLRK
ncbi:DCL family protein [Halomonas salifodinae]|uniref:DCL family protein n=1 Tax=Halomonas salifodinae TaxID=438745 RepID=UPI0033B8D6C2